MLTDSEEMELSELKRLIKGTPIRIRSVGDGTVLIGGKWWPLKTERLGTDEAVRIVLSRLQDWGDIAQRGDTKASQGNPRKITKKNFLRSAKWAIKASAHIGAKLANKSTKTHTRALIRRVSSAKAADSFAKNTVKAVRYEKDNKYSVGGSRADITYFNESGDIVAKYYWRKGVMRYHVRR